MDVHIVIPIWSELPLWFKIVLIYICIMVAGFYINNR